jgi:hypothetical protein
VESAGRSAFGLGPARGDEQGRLRHVDSALLRPALTLVSTSARAASSSYFAALDVTLAFRSERKPSRRRAVSCPAPAPPTERQARGFVSAVIAAVRQNGTEPRVAANRASVGPVSLELPWYLQGVAARQRSRPIAVYADRCAARRLKPLI